MFMNINHLSIQATNDKAEKTTPDFTCSVGNHKYYFHTHAPAAQTIYHLEKNALTDDHPTKRLLIDLAASHRNAIQLTKAVIAKEPPLKFHIPGGKMTRKAQISFYFKNTCPVLYFSNLYCFTLTIYVVREQKTRRTGGSKKNRNISFFGTHVMTLVRMCGFEGKFQDFCGHQMIGASRGLFPALANPQLSPSHPSSQPKLK